MKSLFFLFFMLFSFLISAQEERILVLSGGGARGAWGGGLAEALVTKHDRDYRCVVGSSTGSLLAPLVALQDFDQLRVGYTTITDKDIFNVTPYKTKGKKRGDIKGVQSFLRFMAGKRSLGESKNLRETIKRFYTEEHFNRLQENGREHIATVVNLTKDQVEFKSSNDYTYEEMVEWMWASANVPVFMSLLKKEQNDTISYYVDGGVKEGVPLQMGMEKACSLNINKIDVIVHNTINPKLDPASKGGIFKLLSRTTELFLTETRQNDLIAARRAESTFEVLAQDCSLDEEFIDITYFFMPEDDHNIISKDLLFDQEEMSQLWDQGLKHYTLKLTEDEKRALLIQVEIPKNQACMRAELLGHR